MTPHLESNVRVADEPRRGGPSTGGFGDRETAERDHSPPPRNRSAIGHVRSHAGSRRIEPVSTVLAMWRWRVVRSTTMPGLVLAGTFVSCRPVCNRLERPETHAAMADDPAIGQLVRRGWIPAGLIPAQAREIREMHDIDSNQVWLSFSSPRRDPVEYPGWTRVTAGVEMLGHACDQVSWWHRDLVAACEQGFVPEGWAVYARGNERIALHASSIATFYWRSREPSGSHRRVAGGRG